jgi:predicted dinucleotide-binding enzyme
VVLLAVPYAGVGDALRRAGAASGALAGRVLVDCVNPIGPGFTVAGGARSAAEEAAQAAPGAHVVKAFNLCPDGVWRMRPPVGGDRPLGVPLCGDDAGALAAVRRLVTDIGCVPMDAGPLARAGVLEATAAFVIGMVATGMDPTAALPPLALAGTPVPQGE